MSTTASWSASVLFVAAIVTFPVVLSTTAFIVTSVSAASARAADRTTSCTPVTVPSTSRFPAEEDSVAAPPALTEPVPATVMSPIVSIPAAVAVTSPVAAKLPLNVTRSARSMTKAPTSPSARSMSAAPVAESLSVLPPSTSPRSIPVPPPVTASMSMIPPTASLASVVKPTPVVSTAPAEMLSVRRAADASRSSSPAVIDTSSSSIVPFSATMFTPTAPFRTSFRSMFPEVELSVLEAFVTVTRSLNTRSPDVVTFVSTMMPPAPAALTVVLPRVFS